MFLQRYVGSRVDVSIQIARVGGNRAIAPAIDTNRANQLSDLKTCSEHNDDGDGDGDGDGENM